MAAVGRSFFGRFFGRTIGEGAAFAIGAATAPVLRPALQDLSNLAWTTHPVRPPDAGTLASGVAQGQVDEAQAREWAAQTGIGDAQFTALVAVADTGPGVPAAFDLWRRGLITQAQFEKAAKRQAIEPEWVAALVQTKELRLDPSIVANAIQQGFVPGEGILPADAGGSPPFTPPTEVVPIDATAEAEAHGVDPERLKVLAQLSGNPPGPQELLQMWNRGIITEAAVEHGIREGRTKTKWTSAIKEPRKAVLSATEYAGLHLRGWITEAEMNTGGALTGHSADQMHKLFLNRGRPATPRQIHLGYARGATYIGENLTEAQAISRGVKQSDIRPEWEAIEAQNVWTYPSPFVLRALASDGTFTEAQTHQILIELGWKPEFATAAASKWASGTGSAGKQATKADLLTEYEGRYITEADLLARLAALGFSPAEAQIELHLADARRVKKARDGVVKAIHDSFVQHEIQMAEAEAYLTEEGIPAEAISLLIAEWTREAAVTRKSLTAAQVKRAYAKSTIDRTAAVEHLVDLGYNLADAGVYLDS